MKGVLYFAMVLFLLSCRKESRNELKLDGVWKLENVKITTYSNNEVLTEKDTVFPGTMELIRTKGLYNDVYFTDWEPFGFERMNWNVSEKKLKVITFHTDGLDLPLATYSFNVDKHSFRKLVLTSYSSDIDYNLIQKTSMYFVKR